MRLAIMGAAAVAALGLSGCGTLGGAGGGATADFLKAVATDPNCAHDDELEGITGAAGIPASLRFKVARHCEARPVIVAKPADPPQ
jgi:hypothetical protein